MAKQDTKVITGKVMLSYPHLDKPNKFGNEGEGKEKYGVIILIPKVATSDSDRITLDKIRKAIEAAKLEGKDKKWGGVIPPRMDSPIGDGDEKYPDKKEYAGMYFVNAKSSDKPGVIDGELRDMDPKDAYAGGYARVSINFYAYNTNGKKGIACALNNVQFFGGGTRLSAKKNDAFEDFGDDDELL